MKNWKNAEIVEVGINETANGGWPSIIECEPGEVIGYLAYGAHNVLASNNQPSQPSQPTQPTQETDLPGTPSTNSPS